MFSELKVFEAVGEIIYSLQVVLQLEHSANFMDLGHLLVESPPSPSPPPPAPRRLIDGPLTVI